MSTKLFTNIVNTYIRKPANIAAIAAMTTLWALTSLLYASVALHIIFNVLTSTAMGIVAYHCCKFNKQCIVGNYDTATLDAATNVHNKRYLEDIGSREVKSAIRHQYPLTIVTFTIDDYAVMRKKYSDDVIDRGIISLTDNINKKIRHCDVIARYTNDTFIVLCPSASAILSMKLAKRIHVLSSTLVCTTKCSECVDFTCTVAVTEYCQETDSDLESLISRSLKSIKNTPNGQIAT